jgi:predicted metallo-beta-lactamase superfamily hydrolase
VVKLSLLEKIKIVPLAAESFGVRSMCTFVETPDVKVLLDAGISLCPYRFGLPPHPIEFETINRLRKVVAARAQSADVVTISHYHFDHHTPSFEDWLVNWTQKTETAKQIYEGRRILVKNPREKINPSQRHRAWLFQRTGGKFASSVESADGKSFAFGEGTVLRFSDAVPHGPEDVSLGWVTMLIIEYDCKERFVFAPDVQGPMVENTVNWIFQAKPQVVMLGGPPFYLEGFKADSVQGQQGLRNLEKIVTFVPLTLIEHHSLRDELWKQKIQQVYDAAELKGHKVMTAADYAGESSTFLESKRRQLFLENPPSREFEKWMKESLDSKRIIRPLI